MKQITFQDASELKKFIQEHDFFFVAGHKEPDGDCIASCLGVASILEHFSKQYQLLSAGPFKRMEIMNWKDDFSDTMVFQDAAERSKTGVIIVDCAEIVRLGEIEGDFKNLDLFIIDHHKTSENLKNVKNYVNSDVPACAYIIQIFYEMIIGDIPKNIAEILFFGICTDSGFFRFLSDDSACVFEAVGRLVSYGANPKETYKKINFGKPYSTRKLLGVLLQKAEKYLDGRLIVTYESLEDTKKIGAEGRDSDSLYQLLLSCKGAEVVVFLRQDTPFTCTGGFRSQNEIDVSVVAAKFGGGGHKNASGMSCNGKAETLIPQIVKEFARIM